jgi:threonine dehydrogenase-like Zn-dependent dehydrogenase
MRAYVIESPGASGVTKRPAPEFAAGEVLVRPSLVGLCGTDLELIDGTVDPAYVRYPLVLGHEWVGRLMGDSSLGADDAPVVVEGIVPCGKCNGCHRGDTNLCDVYDEIGFTRAGALAEVMSVPATLVHRLGDDVDFNDAVMVEPMSVVWRALTRLPLRSNLRVAVVGDGTIALLTAHLARLAEPASITVIGRREEQCDLAIRAGASRFLTTTPDETFDLVIEAAGNARAVTSAIALASRGAMVILLGLPPHGTTVAVAPDDLVNNDVVIQASFGYTRRAFQEVVERLNSRELRPSFLITHRFSWGETSRAVEALRGGAKAVPRGKVVVEIG